MAEALRIALALGRYGRCRLAQRADPRAGLRWFLFADDAAHLVVASLFETILVERRGAGQQLVQEHTQRVDVAAGIDIDVAQGRLLRSHV